MFLRGVFLMVVVCAAGMPWGYVAADQTLVPYTGHVPHIFFHSLIVYPDRAFRSDSLSKGYHDYMITRDQFVRILDGLYERHYVLVDIHSLYSVDTAGHVTKKTLLVPEGKKPLVISLDDVSYYSYMRGRGFAQKLVLDAHKEVATAVVNQKGEVEVTRDGDVVPILDDFVKKHPDFSLGGAKGLIALTGFEGVLGYRTQAGSKNRDTEIAQATPVIEQLRATGWTFASHSYSHTHAYTLGTIALADVIRDAGRWQREVEPLVGKTDIFVGPFGQIFGEHDPRRAYLRSAGFVFFCGVGLDQYFKYFPDHVVMDRVDIDGYRIAHNPKALGAFFDVGAVMKE